MKRYLIDEYTLREFIANAHMLNALENGGVDNWEWYDLSIDDYLSEYKMNSFYEIADREMGKDRFEFYDVVVDAMDF